ncbi:MAG: hypothetical protein KJO08_07440 [Gammaproteobacteria bacterium]|nr:hypothetical protein [Gammaproteobacteria bacterium]NNJ83506.1 hypothetical protein [Gammaproteobacteria bacterium]
MKRLRGIFQLPQNREAFGEIRFKGPNSLLNLSSHSEPIFLHETPHLHGTTFDHKKVTCIDCVAFSPGRNYVRQGEDWTRSYFGHCFPHFVTVGDEHVDPGAATVRGIHFTTNDLPSLFYDFDAFGHVRDAESIIDTVLATRKLRGLRPVEAGEWPHVAYFTGKLTVIEVDTDIGKLAVRHQPSHKMGGPNGVFIKNRMVVSLEPNSPVTFHEAFDRMLIVANFLSVIAGRQQSINNIRLQTVTSDDQARSFLSVYWSLAPKSHESKIDYLELRPGDVPLDPIQRPKEFSGVLKNWICRETEWRLSRIRYVSCLSKGNHYDVDRLIAAANMFDILPAEAVPLPTLLPDDLAESKTTCLAILKKHPPGQDRDGAISALKRMGKPSLPKKIQHRTAMVVKHLEPRFDELNYVVKIAVQCRNYFVHGGSDFNFSAVAPFMSFLTDALEFVFAASDLIETGWDAARWNSDSHGNGHTFARFRSIYDIQLHCCPGKILGNCYNLLYLINKGRRHGCYRLELPSGIPKNRVFRIFGRLRCIQASSFFRS